MLLSSAVSLAVGAVKRKKRGKKGRRRRGRQSHKSHFLNAAVLGLVGKVCSHAQTDMPGLEKEVVVE